MAQVANFAQAVIDVYRALHTAAPGSDAGQRFLRDMGSWAIFTALARLCRGERPNPASERDLLGLASIAGIYARSGGRDWLDEQVQNAAMRLCDPTFREKADDAAREMARQKLTERDLAKAHDLASRGAVTMARRNAAGIEGALKEFAAFMNASGTFNRGQPLVAEFRPDLLQRAVDKVHKSLDGLPASLYAFGDPVAGGMVREWLDGDGLDKVLAKYLPEFDDSWLAEHEIASEAAEEQANWERHQHELNAIAEDVQGRTAAYRERFGS